MATQSCGDCGDTLPITADKKVRCGCCGKMNQNTLIGEVTITTWKNSTAPLLMQGEGQDKALSSGANWASIEEDCRFCDATEVRYTTLQTRGAGEGSTVFYFCPTCKRGIKRTTR